MNSPIINIIIVLLFCVLNLTVIRVSGDSGEISYSADAEDINLSLLSPSFSWDISSNKTNYSVSVSTIVLLESGFEEDDVKISLIIEEMSCNQENQEVVSLNIQGADKSRTFCANVNNTKNKFQTVGEVFDDEETIEIVPVGNWSNGTQARLFVSVYVEKESCEKCPLNFFCCGTSRACLKDVMPSELKTNESIENNVRCIPVIKNSTFCDGHPNCGFFCNPDETVAICTNLELNLKVESGISVIVDNDESIEMVWKAILFLATCLLVLATVVVLIAFCHSMQQKGILNQLKLQHRKSTNNQKHNPTVVSSFRYNDEYM